MSSPPSGEPRYPEMNPAVSRCERAVADLLQEGQSDQRLDARSGRSDRSRGCTSGREKQGSAPWISSVSLPIGRNYLLPFGAKSPLVRDRVQRGSFQARCVTCTARGSACVALLRARDAAWVASLHARDAARVASGEWLARLLARFRSLRFRSLVVSGPTRDGLTLSSPAATRAASREPQWFACGHSLPRSEVSRSHAAHFGADPLERLASGCGRCVLRFGSREGFVIGGPLRRRRRGWHSLPGRCRGAGAAGRCG